MNTCSPPLRPLLVSALCAAVLSVPAVAAAPAPGDSPVAAVSVDEHAAPDPESASLPPASSHPSRPRKRPDGATAAAAESEAEKLARRWMNSGSPPGTLVIAGVPVEAPWLANDEIRAFARTATRSMFTVPEKVRALKDAILGLRRLNLHYEPGGNLTAADAFARRTGNCLGFTNLFIAMARASGIDAFYVEVSDVDEFARQGEFIVNNRHICAGYWSGGGFGIIDFVDRPAFAPSYRPVSDLAGLAHFYNNQGYERLRAGDFEQADRMLRVSLALRPGFGWARNNLGVVLGRMDRDAEAEEQYRRAMHDDPRYAPAYSNLAALLAQQGRSEEAEAVYDRLSRVRSRDPYSQYQAGLFALGRGDLEKALKRLRRSASLDPSLTEAHLGLGEAYLASGDRTAARHAFARALKLEPDNLQASLGLQRSGD